MVSTRRSVLGGGVSLLGLLLANRNKEVSAQPLLETVTVHCLVCCTKPCRPICEEACGDDEASAKKNLQDKVKELHPNCRVGPAESGGCDKFVASEKPCCPCDRWTATATCTKEGQLTVEGVASGRTRLAAKRLALAKLRCNLETWGYDPDCCGGCVQVSFDRNSH